TESEEAFGRASRAEAARARLIRRTALGAAFAALASLVLVLLHLNERTKQDLAAAYLEQGRQVLVAGDPVRSLVYLAKAYELGAHGPGLRSLLARASEAADAQLLSLEGHTDQVLSASFSANGARILTASSDGTARVWEAATGHATAVLQGHR